MNDHSPNTDRYHRQSILPQIGEQRQRALARARVLIVGCGALGTVVCEQLARAGVGFLRIVDRDIVELTNLQRQTLFDEADVRDATPKAIAAKRRLNALNSTIEIDARVEDVDSSNVESLVSDVHVILDGTDNAETRYLLNDVAVKHGLCWVYGACVGVEGRVMSIVPGWTACLRCLFEQPPQAGELSTCDTVGVLGPVAAIVGALQAVEALKILLAHATPVLIRIDGWNGTVTATATRDARRDTCPACGKQIFESLDAPPIAPARLCGRNAVQVRSSHAARNVLESVARRLRGNANFVQTPYLIRYSPPDDQNIRMTLFDDGRALIEGTTDPGRARSIYARYVGL